MWLQKLENEGSVKQRERTSNDGLVEMCGLDRHGWEKNEDVFSG